MSEELMRTILRGFLPTNIERFYYVREHVEEQMFVGTYHDLFKLIVDFEKVTGTILDHLALAKVVQADTVLHVEQKAQIEELWNDLGGMRNISEPEFRTSVALLVEAYKEDQFGKILESASTIISDGLTVGRDELFGLNDAIEYVNGGLADLEHVGQDRMPEGDVRDEQDDLISELQQGSAIKRFATGIRPLDDLTHGGPGTGELWIPTAYTGVGKSTICINMAQNFVVTGNNVLYLSLETQRSQIRRRLMVRHAREPIFGVGGVSLDSLNKHKPETPTLGEEELQRYIAAVRDFTTNPEYGHIVIAQAPADSTFSTIRAICNRWNQKFRVDVVIVDSIDLVHSDRRRREKQDELNEVIMAFKGMAMSFDEGRGVPIISPWQINREGEKAAKDEMHGTGSYALFNLAMTSEIERKADCVFAMADKKNSETRIDVNVLKWRDGKKVDFELEKYLDQSYIGSKLPLNRENPDLIELVA